MNTLRFLGQSIRHTLCFLVLLVAERAVRGARPPLRSHLLQLAGQQLHLSLQRTLLVGESLQSDVCVVKGKDLVKTVMGNHSRTMDFFSVGMFKLIREPLWRSERCFADIFGSIALNV